MFNTLRRHADFAATLAIIFAGFTATGVQAQSYVNVSVGGIFSPGVYGQVTFGNAPPPPVYNPRPVVVAPVVVGAPVVYMHVPDEHRHRWSRYCGRYNACGYPVQFVQVNVSNRWWATQGDYHYGEQHEQRRHERRDDWHDNGKHRGHGKHGHDD